MVNIELKGCKYTLTAFLLGLGLVILRKRTGFSLAQE
jgi:hypothetical protein